MTKLDKLLNAIQNEAEKNDEYFSVFIDEMPPAFFENCPDYNQFLDYLHDKYSRVYLFIAISPSGRNLTRPLELQFGKSDKIYARQLRTRHRNSFLLSTLLIHLTYGYNLKKIKKSLFSFRDNKVDKEVMSKYHCLSPTEDKLLDQSKLAEGDVTLWYHSSGNITEIEALKFLKNTYLPDNGEVLVSPSEQNFPQHIHRWCVENNWDVVTHGNVTGTERDLVVAFVDDNFGNLEVMSRAKKRLIILSRYIS